MHPTTKRQRLYLRTPTRKNKTLCLDPNRKPPQCMVWEPTHIIFLNKPMQQGLNTLLYSTSTQPYCLKPTNQPFFSLGHVEQLINKKLKEQSGVVMTIVRDKESHSFITSLVTTRIPKFVEAKDDHLRFFSPQCFLRHMGECQLLRSMVA